MPSWLKQVTYLTSVVVGISATIFPQYQTILLGVSTFLAGYATTHPSDVAPEPSATAVAELALQLQQQIAAVKKT